MFYTAQIEHAHFMQTVAMVYDLNPIDLRALKFLGAIGGQPTPKELGKYLQMGTGAVTALLDRLTKKGFLDRVRNPDDRRSVRIELTSDGQELIAYLRRAYRQALVDTLPAEGMTMFITLTQHLADAFRTASGEVSRP